MARFNLSFAEPSGSSFEESHPFALTAASTGQTFRLNRAEASLLWRELEIALRKADEAEEGEERKEP